MDLRDTPEEAAFRQEVREFIAENLPDSSKGREAPAGSRTRTASGAASSARRATPG